MKNINSVNLLILISLLLGCNLIPSTFRDFGATSTPHSTYTTNSTFTPILPPTSLTPTSIPETSTPLPTLSFSIGNKATYVDLSKCSPLAQATIHIKNFPTNLIYRCEVEEVELDNSETVTLIKIYYGEGMDCPAGCIYENYAGIFTQNQSLVDLPDVQIDISIWGRSPINHWKNMTTIDGHRIEGPQQVTKINGNYGWIQKFDLEAVETYWHDASSEVKKRKHTAIGEIFVYLDTNGKEIWDYSGFEVTAVEVN